MDDEACAIVIDNGSGTIKSGFAGKEKPNIFPSIVGRLRSDVSSIENDMKTYVGDEAREKACVFNLQYPIEHGIIQNWDDMVTIWNYTLHCQSHYPSEHPVMIIEALKNPKVNREKTIQIMFETFDVKSFYIDIQGSLSILSTGRTTGISCSIGDGVSEVLPVIDGIKQLYCCEKNDLGGRDLISYLRRYYQELGYDYSTSEEKEILRDIIEKKGYVALDWERECKKVNDGLSDIETNYHLPDGSSISLAKNVLKFQN